MNGLTVLLIISGLLTITTVTGQNLGGGPAIAPPPDAGTEAPVAAAPGKGQLPNHGSIIHPMACLVFVNSSNAPG